MTTPNQPQDRRTDTEQTSETLQDCAVDTHPNAPSLQARVMELERRVQHLELAVRRQIRLGRMTD